VDKNFEKFSLKTVAQDGLYMYLRELNNTANKKERDALRIKECEKPDLVKAKRTKRKRGGVTEGKYFQAFELK